MWRWVDRDSKQRLLFALDCRSFFHSFCVRAVRVYTWIAFFVYSSNSNCFESLFIFAILKTSRASKRASERKKEMKKGRNKEIAVSMGLWVM